MFWRPEKAIFRNRKKIEISWRQNNFDGISSVGTLKKRIFRIRKKSLLRIAKSTETEWIRVFFASNQPWSNFLFYDALKKWIFRIRKKSLFHGDKTTLTLFLVFWRTEKVNFPNPKEIAFSWRQHNLDDNSSLLVRWKIEFSKPETKIDSSWLIIASKIFLLHEKAISFRFGKLAFSRRQNWENCLKFDLAPR